MEPGAITLPEGAVFFSKSEDGLDVQVVVDKKSYKASLVSGGPNVRIEKVGIGTDTELVCDLPLDLLKFLVDQMTAAYLGIPS